METAFKPIASRAPRFLQLKLERRRGKLRTQDLAHNIVSWIEEKKAEDIILLDVHEITLLADYFILCNANSERHFRTLTEEVQHQIRAQGNNVPVRVEGEPESGWVLVDLGSVVLHIFSPEKRAYYDLEGLWNKARTIVRIP